MPKKRLKQEKPIEEMTDRELAEHALGKELVERLHEEFDLKDSQEMTSDDRVDDFMSPR